VGTVAELLTSKIPPHSLEAERAVLGGLLLEREAWPRLAAQLTATDFLKEGHRTIFEALGQTYATGWKMDILTVTETLRRLGVVDEIGGPAALSQLLEEAVSLANLDSYAAIIREYATRRELIQVSTELISRAYESGQPALNLVVEANRRLGVLASRMALPTLAAAPQPMDVTELHGQVLPDDPGPVAGGIVVRRGLTVVGGGPKLGKTTLMQNMVLQRSRGRPWLGFPTRPGVTLVVQFELPDAELQKRTRLMLKDEEDAPPTGAVYFLSDRRIKLDRPEGIAILRPHLERLRPDLLVVDPLARAMTGDENSAKDMGAVITALDLLIQDFELSILLVHHTSKPNPDGREGGHRLRGSSALFAAADSVLLLDRSEGGFRLTFELRHGKAPEPMGLERTESLWFAPAGPPEDLLAVAGTVRLRPLTWGQFVAAIKVDEGVSKATAERLIQRALKARLIAKNNDGHYIATLTHPHGMPEGGESARE
jgi:replicative DNA helicase